jgi:hypothetical protein
MMYWEDLEKMTGFKTHQMFDLMWVQRWGYEIDSQYDGHPLHGGE